jgi:AcrR family transcriptional regulator
MSSAIPYEETGRTRQKARTRGALVAAARKLMAEGSTPTVEEAAAKAEIARATAYRYFADQRSLLIATLPRLSQTSLLGDSPPADARARLELVAEAIAGMAVEHEPALRNMLRLSLEPGREKGEDELTFRKGRRITWVSEALEPVRGALPGPHFDRLVLAIAAAVGIDALVWLTDIGGLTRDHAAEVMRWSASALLEAALGEQDRLAPSAG